jgi:chemotaxis signal transduction protein/nucleoid-associated protein YgaU
MRTLYLIDLGGRQYGIWKDEVASVRDVRTIHRLPLSPACMAGISVVDNRSTALADLAVCIGLQPTAIAGGSRAIFVAGKDADSGFIIPDTLEEADIPGDNLFPIPDYVKTAEVDTCVIHDSRPVPVINITSLYNHLHEADPDPSVPAFTLPSVQNNRVLERRDMRLFSAGGELFAVPAGVIRGPAVRPGILSPLALTPAYLRGLAVHERTVLPVVHLAERMGLPGRGDAELMMVADLSGIRFGFLIDEDTGTLPVDGLTVTPFPPVAETGWTPAAVLESGSVIPLVDIPAVLDVAGREHAAKNPAGRYAPDSRFPELFGLMDVEVVEFSLLGVKHALPKTEVEDVVPIKPYRRLPDTLPIVIGVTEHDGEVLPVLDLALVFGRRSLETPEWSMVLVRNGDFRAFVITERVAGERVLSRDVQRKVPIILPYNLVYGCYPEGGVVRLVLNVEALAVHFDKSIVKELLPALTREMAGAPAELVPSLLPDEHFQDERRPAAPSMLEQVTAAKIEAEAAAQARQAEEAKIREEAEARARAEAGERARREAEVRMQREAEEKARAEAEAKERADAEARERREAEARAQQEAVERARQEAIERSRREAEERARAVSEEQARREAEERAQAEAEAGVEQEERARREAEEQKRRAEEQARAEAEERAIRKAEAKAREEAAAAIREGEEIKRRLKPESAPSGAGTAVRADSYRDSSSPSSREMKHRKPLAGSRYAFAGLAVLLVAVLVYFGVIRELREARIKEPANSARTTEVQPNETVKDPAPPAFPEKPVQEGPLVLTVPAERAIETDLYIVKKGDTLWDICERFTGDPFNYPRGASDNRIANPDLIFPGQKIELKK